MLAFNKKDEHLPNWTNYQNKCNLLRYNYKFGFKNEDNPSLLLEYNPNIVGISTNRFDF